MSEIFKIGNKSVGGGQPVFLVAEISANHHQKYEEAVKLVRAAREAGADAVKLQTYTPDTITLNSDKEWFRVGGENNPDDWQKKTLYQLYQAAYTPWEWQPKLKKLADDLDIILFSTPFDESAVDFLESIEVPCYKIASYEVNDFLLLRRVARTGKPVIISLGYASAKDADFAIKTLRENGAKDIAALHCVTQYETEPDFSGMNLATIKNIAERFDVVSGFSDNNAGIEAPLIAAAAGAKIIEKHVILDRKSGGSDAGFSLEPQEFKLMAEKIRAGDSIADGEKTKIALGGVHYGPASAAEEHNKRFRRSLFVCKNIKRGEKFSPENIRSVRPAFGLPTKHFDEIIGRAATADIEFGTPLKKEHIKGRLDLN
ncbi:MAG: pseudaminic acid synthase [Candidatus Niyogibacteria bacterium]|nr:MAG: pseudaminic acid synthase [Candidatus Niyogibacteria bacterium]